MQAVSEVHFMAPRHWDSDQTEDVGFQKMLREELQQLQQSLCNHLQEELQQLELLELRHRAEAQGIPAEQIDVAAEADNSAGAITNLIVSTALPGIVDYGLRLASRQAGAGAISEGHILEDGQQKVAAKVLANQICNQYFGDLSLKEGDDSRKIWAHLKQKAIRSSQEERDAQRAADDRRARLEAFAAAAADEEAEAVEKMAASPAGEKPDEPLVHWVHERGSLRNLHGDIDSSVSSLAATVASLQAKLAAASVEQNQTRRTFEETKQQETIMAVTFHSTIIPFYAHSDVLLS